MRIIIIDDHKSDAEKLKIILEHDSNYQIEVDIALNEGESISLIEEQRNSNNSSYQAFLVDQNLKDEVKGEQLIPRLFEVSPETESILFTSNDAEAGMKALKAGARDYVDRLSPTFSQDLLRCLLEIQIEQKLDEAITKASGAHETQKIAQLIVDSTKLLGVERARLWRCLPIGGEKITTFRGWAHTNIYELENFRTIQMPVDKSTTAQIVINAKSDKCIFEQKSDSYLATVRPSYKPPLGKWIGLRLKWGGKIQAVLILDNDQKESREIDARMQKLLMRFSKMAASALERAEIQDQKSERLETLIEARQYVDRFLKRESLSHLDQRVVINERSIWLLSLTAITIGNSIGLNRALLFFKLKNGKYVTHIGVGNFSKEKDQQIAQDFDRDHFGLGDWVNKFELGEREESDLENLSLEFGAANLEEVFVSGKKKIAKTEIGGLLPQQLIERINLSDCALLPVAVGDRKIGVLCVDNHTYGKEITDDNLKDSEQLIAYTAQAIQVLRERRNANRLLELGNNSFDTGELENNLKLICDEALSVTGADLAIIYTMPLPTDSPVDVSSYEHAVGSGNMSEESLKRRHTAGGLTDTVFERKKVLARSIISENVQLLNQKPLAGHDLIEIEKLRGLFSFALTDETGDRYGVLHIGYRNDPLDASGDEIQAEFIARIARRAIRAEWRRNVAYHMRREEVEAHRNLMEYALSENKSGIQQISYQAIHLLQKLLGKRVDKECMVYILAWKPASETADSRRIRMDYCFREGKPNLSTIERKEKEAYLGITGRSLIQRESIIKNKPREGDGSGYIADVPGVECELAVPLQDHTNEYTIGINVESSQENAFSESDKDLIQRFGKVLVSAIEKSQVQRQVDIAFQAAETMTRPFQLDETLNKIVESIREVAEDVTSVTLWHKDPDNPEHYFSKHFGKLPSTSYRQEKDGSILMSEAVYLNELLTTTQRPKYLSDAQNEVKDSRFISNNGIASAAHIPLIIKTKDGRSNNLESDTVGILFLDYLKKHNFTNTDTKVFNFLAQIAASSIRDAHMSEELGRDMAIASYTSNIYELAHGLKDKIDNIKILLSLVSKPEETRSKEQDLYLQRSVDELNKILDVFPPDGGEDGQEVISSEAVKKIIEDILSRQKQYSSPVMPIFKFPDQPINFIASSYLLESVIGRIIENALKKEFGAKTLYTAFEVKNGMARIIIWDDGCGISKDVIPSLFHHPILSTNEYRKSHKGMGLLLAHNLVKLAGGRLSYEGSEKNPVAKFMIEFQVAENPRSLNA